MKLSAVDTILIKVSYLLGKNNPSFFQDKKSRVVTLEKFFTEFF